MFPKVIYCLVVVVDMNLNVVSVTTYVQTIRPTRSICETIGHWAGHWCKTFPLFTFAPCQCAYVNYVFLYISIQYEYFTPF